MFAIGLVLRAAMSCLSNVSRQTFCLFFRYSNTFSGLPDSLAFCLKSLKHLYR